MPEFPHTEVDRPLTIDRLVRTLYAYTPAILLSMAAVAVVYIVVAVALYIFSPEQRVVTLHFRLDFEGAPEGVYPNKTKFSSSDIIAPPILQKVYQADDLRRYVSFESFRRSLIVLEANPDYQRLAADYQSRLADPKLNAIDRERLQREWQAKIVSLAKNDYSLDWIRTPENAQVPESLVKQVLSDIVTQWERFATAELRVLKHRISVLTPEVVHSADGDGEPLVAIQILRSTIYEVLQNIDTLREIPASELVRTSDGMSLAETRLRLEEIVRFRLEPLAGRIAAAGQVRDRAATLRFLESQLAYDRRQLKATEEGADAIRQSLALYTPDLRASESAAVVTREAGRQTAPNGERIVPQLSDSFIDRLVNLTLQSNNVLYRQKLADEYRTAAKGIPPIQQAVTYDGEILNLVRAGSQSGAGNDAAVLGEIAATQNEVRRLVGRVDEIYDIVSKNLNPSKGLYTVTVPPAVRTERTRSLAQLGLYGVALLALSLPVIIVLCLMHAARAHAEQPEVVTA